ncbi:Tkp5 protein [Vanderwaltozyma polyspora DSM 70294]|uniref:Tkp5 protein n=1 Tax=Vanderwaltozyma polyspora (strain ATCC 22028 / DSM 70294 / BCRC 21397 / CBS 2163 / NBRC 10782 / NRRL Y-8283 / UCD 57-17) TaxID=436907 RepID=A7TT77_VANPO|nr:Tkp5 protein [Vanderwaltozyma polyspora DSM 70294]XP_001642389.1 Tkp5 protein [Vanderwaltozyma polyspora DSM 70294]EDO14448.1 Tkp5 protein [Vanderwaltozyma polyspora DSM 70294]EDO14531.1 Tkp5 protein [Vanderwaltozyma polyspora DSM 70294]
MDVDTAFLNSQMEDAVYVKQPPSFIDSDPAHEGWVWKLYGGMYGLKQAPLFWNKHINRSLTALGFTRNEKEFGLYFKQTADGPLLIGLYVDDLLIAAPSPRILSLTKKKLQELYSMKDLGPVFKFLGMNITQFSNGNITLSLADYIAKAAPDQQTPLHKKVHIPLFPTINYFDDNSPVAENVPAYQRIVDQLIFIANAGRPDIAYSVSLLPRFLKDPRVVHVYAAHRVMQYLYTTCFQGLSYRAGSPLQLTVYSDASHGSLADMPFSTGGYVTRLAGGCVTWSSKKIKTTVSLLPKPNIFLLVKLLKKLNGSQTCSSI